MNNIFIGFLSGFLVFFVLHYIPSKQRNIKMELDLLIKKRCYHIHHWITVVLILIMVYICRFCSNALYEIIIGLLLGILAEDFLFRNIFNLYNCNRH